jgi:flagellin-like hook-associated protein FlgL
MLAALCVRVGAQTPSAPRADVPLPASNAVVFVNVKRLLTEAMPRALASDAQRSAQVNADIEQFKTRTGVDARTLDTLTVGARIVKLPSGATKFDNVVAVARGAFSTDAIVAAGRASAAGVFTQQPYGGKTIYVFSFNDRIKVFGLAKMHVSDLGIVALDQNTLAVGDPRAVRSAIDAAGGRGRVDQRLLNSVVNTNDIIAFAGNVPAGALENAGSGMSKVDRAIASIRAFRGSIGTTQAGYQMTTVLRTTTTAEANQLFKSIDGLRQIAPGIIMAAGERWKFALALVNNLKINTTGNEVNLRLDIAQSEVGNILRAL